ncbi:MAG: hypothetical protein ACE5J1_02175 [Nitrospiria bacterium]
MNPNQPTKKTSTSRASDPNDFRCFCGSLIARFCKKGLELKCKRCKRLHIIPFSDIIIDALPQPLTKT